MMSFEKRQGASRLFLRAKREERRLSQAALGRLVGVERSTIWALEHGRANGSVGIWDRLEDVLGVPQRRLREIDGGAAKAAGRDM